MEVSEKLDFKNSDMATFLSTLIQTTAALMAILLAAITAYYVFLQSKSAEYTDRINSEKASIRQEIATLQAGWPPGLRMLVPPEFKETFSRRSGNLHGVQVVNALATATIFSTPELQATLEEIKSRDSFGGEHWQGRVYFLALDEAVKVLSAGSQVSPAGFTLGQPELKQSLSDTFPQSAYGPGFEEWRKDFEQVSTADRFLEGQTEIAIADFDAFTKSKLTKSKLQRSAPYFLQYYTRAVRTVHPAIGSIRSHVRTIDGLQVLNSQYTFSSRVHAKPLLFLVSLAVIVGVVAPLFALTAENSVTPLAARAILTATLALVTASFLQFAIDVFKPLQEDPRLYVTNRWIRPIAQDLDGSLPQIDSASTVSIERVSELLASGYVRQLPDELLKKLRKYESDADAYNRSAEELNSAVVRYLQTDVSFETFRQPYQTGAEQQRLMLHPGDIINPARLEQLRAGVVKMGEVRIQVETPMWWGSRGQLALIAPARRQISFLTSLSTLSEHFSHSSEQTSFLQQKATLLLSTSELKKELSTFPLASR